MKKELMCLLMVAICIFGLSACAGKGSPGAEKKVQDIQLNKNQASQDGQNGTDDSEKNTSPAASASEDTGETAGRKEKKTNPSRLVSHAKLESFGSVVKVGDSAYELYNYVDSAAKAYASVVNQVAKALEGRAEVYDIVAPTSIGITFPDNLLGKINSSDQRKAISSIYRKVNDSVQKVSLYDALMPHRSEYIFYRTDHHWTARGAYYAYREFCDEKGITPNDLSAYQKDQFGDYLGSFYLDTKKAAGLKKDQMKVYYPLNEKKMTLTYHNQKGGTYDARVIANGNQYSTTLKYCVFIAGDNPYSVIKNKAVKDGSSCIVVKESYANPFIPYLADHYRNIYIVDYRYWSGSVTALAKEKSVDDVIFLNNISMTRNAYLIGKLKQCQ